MFVKPAAPDWGPQRQVDPLLLPDGVPWGGAGGTSVRIRLSRRSFNRCSIAVGDALDTSRALRDPAPDGSSSLSEGRTGWANPKSRLVTKLLFGIPLELLQLSRPRTLCEVCCCSPVFEDGELWFVRLTF